jgi:serine/threonine protein phosphatase PrpC
MTGHTSLKLQAASGTDTGLVRKVNQDVAYSWVSNPRKGGPLALLIVADGMGGGLAGEIASRLAVDKISRTLVSFLERDAVRLPKPPIVLEGTLRSAIRQANGAIYDYAQRNLIGAGTMGTTIACALIQGTLAVVANVGDSRVYLLGGGGLEQLTADHSMVAQLIESGLLDGEALFDHPRRNILTRALGTNPKVEIDVSTINLSVDDRLLLCSDGLWGMLQDVDQLERILRRAETPEMAVGDLLAAANAQGGEDNISVVVCDVLSG